MFSFSTFIFKKLVPLCFYLLDVWKLCDSFIDIRAS